jgi:predicted DNA-binding WGR domain protein
MSTREFTFQEGASDKFWKITLDGKATTVNFGRRGTSGQVQTKEYASVDEAKKTYDKLISEKTKKGYVETAESSKGKVAASTAVAPKAEQPKALKAEKIEKPGKDSPAVEPAGPVLVPVKIDIAALNSERRLFEDSLEYLWAGWRKTEVTLPAARAFDVEACIAQLGRLKKLAGRYSNSYDCGRVFQRASRPAAAGAGTRRLIWG